MSLSRYCKLTLGLQLQPNMMNKPLLCEVTRHIKTLYYLAERLCFHKRLSFCPKGGGVLRGRDAWQGGMRVRGVCGGGACVSGGVCMAGGHGQGACVVGGAMSCR